MKYLGIEPKNLRIGVFDFTGCEGCELQLANKEETLADFLGAVDIVQFREITDVTADHYDLALVEGAITRGDEFSRIMEIRKNAKILVALGSCACFGGVNRLKNSFGSKMANRTVYGDNYRETLPVRSIDEVVRVDMKIPGCPVSKDEVEKIVKHLVWDIPLPDISYPVCFECKQNFTVCSFEKNQLCLGPITRGGCKAPCPSGGLGCWGCRGPTSDPNYNAFREVVEKHGFSQRELVERLEFFSGFRKSSIYKEAIATDQ